MVLPVPHLLPRLIMGIAVALLQTGEEGFPVPLDPGDILVRQPVPAELCLALELLPVRSDVPPTHAHLQRCRKQAAVGREVP